jgi:hypothetical protein
MTKVRGVSDRKEEKMKKRALPVWGRFLPFLRAESRPAKMGKKQSTSAVWGRLNNDLVV